MGNERAVLPVVPVPGLRADSPGNYLVSLGLLGTLARSHWPCIRGAWKSGIFCVVGGPDCVDEMLKAVSEIAAKRAWTPYRRGWADAQKQSTKKKSGRLLALWQASADEEQLQLLIAHAVPASRVSFNPLLGSGGNAGKRDFSEGWERAIGAIENEPPDAAKKRAELGNVLLGAPVSWMIEKLNAACWFSDANKLYNSGQHPYREGAISPWAMVLACEGLAIFAGSASRRLGSRARAVGAFPFVTRAAAPNAAGEAGRNLAELWAPVWERPMSLPEVVTLFSRGRAESGGRGALTPSAFATAIMRRGVDAGITEFRRFVLARTTSANTFEPRFDGVFQVRVSVQPASSKVARLQVAASLAMERLLSLLDQFVGPLADRKVGRRWRYVGLRGGVERAMLQAAESPWDPEAACGLLDSVVASLDRIDRNRAFRERRVTWESLPLEWLPALFGDEAPGPEARLALALVSSFPVRAPFALYRFGADLHGGGRFTHPPQIPKNWVWRSVAPLPQTLSDILYRRTLRWEECPEEGEPARVAMPAACVYVAHWLSGSLDNELLARWLSRLALFTWRTIPVSVRSLAVRCRNAEPAGGDLCLFGLIQPLFDLCPLDHPKQPTLNLLPREGGARTPAAARRLLGLLRARDVTTAVSFASSRYAMAGTSLMRSAVPCNLQDVGRFTASLLFTVFGNERSALVGRWLRPRREQGGSAS